MLTDYDAKAVAEVMGLAFLRTSESRPAPSDPVKAAKSPKGPATGDFVIYVDDAPLLVVETKTHRATPLSPPSAVLIEKAVQMGLPRRALRHVAESLAGGDKAKVARVEWGIVPKTTLERREKQLSPEESERTERVARLFVHARRALGSDAEARDFMTTPHPQLEGRTPLDAGRTDLGTRRTEQILNALEYGLAL